MRDGAPDAPAMLLLSNAAAPMTLWDPVIPALAGSFRVIRVDPLGQGTAGGYDVPAQVRRVGEALDRLGVRQVTAVGHSSGGYLATALAERRPGTVTALALINTGPGPDAKIPDGLLLRFLQAPVPGRLLWRLRTADTIRKAARTGFTRPVEIPDTLIQHTLGMTYQALSGTMRGYWDYLSERSVPDRLAALGLPLLVIFGAEDRRWRSESAAGYRAVPGARVTMLPGVGHTPLVEDPRTTAGLLLDFAGECWSPGRERKMEP